MKSELVFQNVHMKHTQISIYEDEDGPFRLGSGIKPQPFNSVIKNGFVTFLQSH